MKHIEAGKQVGLRMKPNGEVFLLVKVLNERNNKSKMIDFLLDTGFNGYLQLNKSDADELDLKLINKSATRGFDGVSKEIGITETKIMILDQEISNFPIQIVPNGVSLIGTQLLKDTRKMLIIDYPAGYETITSDEKIKNEVKQIIDELAG